MALSREQKRLFTEALGQYLETLQANALIPIGALENLVDFEVSPRAIGGIVSKEFEETLYVAPTKVNGRTVYCKGSDERVRIPYNFIMKKERNFLCFCPNNDSTFFVKYDFANNTFVTPNDKVIEADKIVLVGDGKYEMMDFLTIIKRDTTNHFEWVFNYIDNYPTVNEQRVFIRDLDRNLDWLPNVLPRGFHSTIVANGNKIPFLDLKVLVMSVKYGKWALLVKDGLYEDRLETLIDNNISFDDFKKCYLIDVKDNNKFALDGVSVVNKLCNYISASERLNPKPIFTFDTNRGLSYNLQTWESVYENAKNRIFNANLQKLNFLNGVEFNGLVVVVPQNANDLTEEGSAQNNCVGHYYNRSIAMGENLIYFLRKKNNVGHSYITCRYNIRNRTTVEYKYKNNAYISQNSDDYRIIATISKQITKTLFP